MPSIEWNRLNDVERGIITATQQDTPVRVSMIAKALGVTVKSATLPPGISGEIRPNPEQPETYIIRINRHDSPERQRFTVAHELAHFLLHRQQIGDGIRDDVLYRSALSDKREAEANRLAADILMPQQLIDRMIERAELLGVDDMPRHLAKQFQVSEAAMKIRLGLS